ncbi:MAG: hypothetical protein ACJ789_00915 [Thermomicrobiales bacterium]
MTDPDSLEPDIDAIAESPSEPEDVASAARSCLVILIILAALILVGCMFGVVAIFR